jgi:hypothetical protein
MEAEGGATTTAADLVVAPVGAAFSAPPPFSEFPDAFRRLEKKAIWPGEAVTRRRPPAPLADAADPAAAAAEGLAGGKPSRGPVSSSSSSSSSSRRPAGRAARLCRPRGCGARLDGLKRDGLAALRGRGAWVGVV